jgi:hypothetical protein
LGLNTYADALDSISEGKWLLNGSTVSYKVGQPMGLYGSFPLFHMTHSFLLRLAWKLARGQGRVEDFARVLGDDVIITHPILADKYHSLLLSVGVDVNPHKSIISYDVGQFAGFTCIKHKKVTQCYRPFKWTSYNKSALNVLNTI